MKPTVLLVEDDPITRTFLYTATQALDVKIDQAASMLQAQTLAARTRHAAWLLDAQLPDGHAIELLEHLRQRIPDVPALVHTAITDQAELQRLRDAGFDMAISKPLSMADWQATVRALLDAPSSQTLPPPLWDDAAGLNVLGGDTHALKALRQLFTQELPQQMKALAHAHTEGDGAAIEAIFHRLTASCGFVGAARLAAAAQRNRRGNSTALAETLQVAKDTLATYPAL